MSNEEAQSGTSPSGGLGQDATIPNTDDGIAVGHSPGATTFEPEEDAGADEEVAAAEEDAAEKDAAEKDAAEADHAPAADGKNRGEQNLDDTIDGAPGPLE